VHNKPFAVRTNRLVRPAHVILLLRRTAVSVRYRSAKDFITPEKRLLFVRFLYVFRSRPGVMATENERAEFGFLKIRRRRTTGRK